MNLSIQIKLLIGLLLLFLLNFCGPDRSEPESRNIITNLIPGDTLTIGVISDRVQEDMLLHQEMLKYLKEKLPAEDIAEINLLIAKTPEEMIERVNMRRVDIVFDSPFPVKLLMESTDLELFMKQWKAGFAKYKSVFFSKSNSGIKSLDDLKGRIIGLDRVYSTSGFYLPIKKMEEAGFTLIPVNDLAAEVNENEIGYVLTGDDENTIYWVLEGKIIAAVTDNISLEQFANVRINELKIFDETEEVPRYLLLVSKSLDERIKSSLQNVLINMTKTDYSIGVMKRFYGTTKFDTLTVADYQIIENL